MERTAPSSIFSERPVATAIAISVISLAPHFFLPPGLSLVFAAILLGLIAGVYLGFAVMNGDNVQQIVEFNVTCLFSLAAFLGIAVNPWFIPLAYLAHGIWDFAHHNRARFGLVPIPQWYVPWCAMIDAVVGLGLIGIWHSNGVL